VYFGGWCVYFGPDDFRQLVPVDGVPAPIAAECLDKLQAPAALGVAGGVGPLGRVTAASPTRIMSREASDSTHSRTGCQELSACVAAIALVRSSLTISFAVSVIWLKFHSASRNRVCRRAHGTAVGSGANSSPSTSGQPDTVASSAEGEQ
jgi:hypothetical protein